MPIDMTKYNPFWDFLRELISHRDRNRCARCKAPHLVRIWRMRDRSWRPCSPEENASGARSQKTPPPPGAKALILCVCSVAHLDWDRANDAPENLALLCQQCHLDHDRPQHLYRTLKSKYRRAGQVELIELKPPRPRM